VQEQLFVPDKGVCPAVIPPMAVTEEDNPGGIVKGNVLGRLKDLGQSPVRAGAPAIVDALWNWQGERRWMEYL